MENSVKIFKVLGDKSRMQIIELLADGEKCACVLLEKLDISQSTLSHHMKILCDSEVANCRKDGKWCYYSINSNIMNDLKNQVSAITPKPEYYAAVIDYCLKSKSKNPIEIFMDLSKLPYFGMMGVFHHSLVASSLLTAYKNCGKKINLEQGIKEIQKRAENVPPMACMKLGDCGAAVSAGIFISVAKGVSLDSNEYFGIANGMTAKVLNEIKKIGGPRCCKRHSYISLLCAVEYSNEYLDINMESSKITCKKSSENKLCLKSQCPFWIDNNVSRISF